jgi:hypothetical protein
MGGGTKQRNVKPAAGAGMGGSGGGDALMNCDSAGRATVETYDRRHIGREGELALSSDGVHVLVDGQPVAPLVASRVRDRLAKCLARGFAYSGRLEERAVAFNRSP